VLVMNMLQTHTDRWDTIRDWMTSVHAVPSLGRQDQGAGTSLRDLAVDGFGMHRDSNSIDLAGKDADIEVMEECEIAVGGVIGTRQFESQGEKLCSKAEQQVDHSSPLEPQGGRSSLVGRTSEHHCLLHTARQGAQDTVVVQLLECQSSFYPFGEVLWFSLMDCCQKTGRFWFTYFIKNLV
jgi:hypothetical protein